MVQDLPVVHVFGVTDVDVAAVLLGGERTVPTRQRGDYVTGNISEAAAGDCQQHQQSEKTKHRLLLVTTR